MATTSEEFQKYEKMAGAREAKNRMTLSEKIEMYGLWCVAVRGKCDREKPSILKPLAYGKWLAWKKYEHMSQEEARARFIKRAKEILKENAKL